MTHVFKGLRAVLYWISVTAMTVMLGLIFFQVVSRYVFGFSLEWSEELARFLFVWTVFLGSALIMGESGHLAVRLLPEKLSGTWAGISLDLFINACSYIFILLLIVQGGKMTETMTFQTAPGLGISMSWVYAVLPLSGLLMILYLGKETLRILAAARALSERKGG